MPLTDVKRNACPWCRIWACLSRVSDRLGVSVYKPDFGEANTPHNALAPVVSTDLFSTWFYARELWDSSWVAIGVLGTSALLAFQDRNREGVTQSPHIHADERSPGSISSALNVHTALLTDSFWICKGWSWTDYTINVTQWVHVSNQFWKVTWKQSKTLRGQHLVSESAMFEYMNANHNLHKALRICETTSVDLPSKTVESWFGHVAIASRICANNLQPGWLFQRRQRTYMANVRSTASASSLRCRFGTRHAWDRKSKSASYLHFKNQNSIQRLSK